MIRHRLALALLLSLLLHLSLIGVPGWRLPTFDDPLTSAPLPLEAQLSPKPVVRFEQPVVPPSPAVRRQPTVRQLGTAVRSTEATSIPEVLPDPLPAVVSEAVPAGPEAPLAVRDQPAVALSLPAIGSIRFSVGKGEQNTVFGESLHRWRHDDRVYTLNSVNEVKVFFLKAYTELQRSEGEIDKHGLRPRLFSREKNGVAGDTASFDWAGSKLMLSGGAQREVSLLPGTQDMLSAYYLASTLSPKQLLELRQLWITTGSKSERYEFKLLAEETLPTEFGELRVRHFRLEGTDTTDIWASLDLQGLPVKICFVDRKGESWYLYAKEIEYEGMPRTFIRH